LKGDYFKNVLTQLSAFEKKLGNNKWFAGNKVGRLYLFIPVVMWL